MSLAFGDLFTFLGIYFGFLFYDNNDSTEICGYIGSFMGGLASGLFSRYFLERSPLKISI